jgi:nucleotide-binding universal stress UspA family protein
MWPAVSISEQHNAELYALHVIHPADVDLFGATGEMSAAAYHTINMNKEAQKYLDNVKLKASEKNIQIKTETIASTNTAGGIVDYAEDKGIDLIVIGTRGKSGFKKMLLGSVASKVWDLSIKQTSIFKDYRPLIQAWYHQVNSRTLTALC